MKQQLQQPVTDCLNSLVSTDTANVKTERDLHIKKFNIKNVYIQLNITLIGEMCKTSMKFLLTASSDT